MACNVIIVTHNKCKWNIYFLQTVCIRCSISLVVLTCRQFGRKHRESERKKRPSWTMHLQWRMCAMCCAYNKTIDALNMQCVSALFSVHCAHTIASCSYPLAFHSIEHTALHGRHKPYLTSYRAIELVTHRWPQFSWSDYYVRHLNATLKPVKRRIQYSVEYFANIN